MATYPGPSPIEEKRPSFLKRPVPMWAFLLLVIIIILILFVPAFFLPPLPTVEQPLILTPDSRTISITQSETMTANFTVANLNTTNTISTTAIATLSPPNVNITLTISGVQTGNSFVASSNGQNVSFAPGGNTLVVRVVSNASAAPGNYTIRVSLSA